MQDGEIFLIWYSRQYLSFLIGGVGQHGEGLIAVSCDYNLIESLNLTVLLDNLDVVRVSLYRLYRTIESHIVSIWPGERFHIAP